MMPISIKAEKVVSEIVESVSQQLRLDRRFVVLDYIFRNDVPAPHVKFIVSSSFIEKGLRSFLKKYRAEAESSLKLGSAVLSYAVETIPSATIGAKKFVLCNVSVAPVMKYNSHQSEQVTQVLLGESADVLEQRAGWVRIRLRHDDYLGWASANQLHVIDEKELAEWQSKIKIGSHDLIMPLLESPRKNSGAIGEFLFGTFLPVKTVTKAWTSVIMPDGKIGWVQSSAVTQPNEKKTVTTGHLAETAKRFLGISYQWGGRSVKGFDCSGFTQTVYRLNGVDIPRDASLQSLTGKEIGGPKRKSAPKALMNFVEGDLLFFSANNAAESFPPKRITHVAMSLSGTEFIHASGSVKVNSFDESQPHFNELLLRDFVGACRIIG